MSTTTSQAIYDARALGKPKMTLLGLQHLFAMFGATVLVPVITGLSVSATLLFAGLGTLLFHFLTQWKVPAFLGSSFAFLGGYAAVTQMGAEQGLSLAESLPYACIGVVCAGLMYFILAGLFAAFGPKKVMRFFPPVVTGPIIIAIGLCLSGSAISNCSSNWWIALLAIAIIIVCNIWGKGMIKIVPILLGVLGSYIVAACFGLCDFGGVKEAAEGAMKGILQYVEEPIVSIDIIDNTHSSIFDSLLTQVMDGNFVKIVSWYDNEKGYSTRVGDLAAKLAKLL